MASSNRAVVFEGTRDMRVESLDFPKLEMPNGKKAPTESSSGSSPPTSAGPTCISTEAPSPFPRAWSWGTR